MLKRLTQAEFKKIYTRVPRLCVQIILRNKDGILLTKRAIKSSYDGYWHIPGGTVFYHEGLESAIKRIAKNELGIEVKIVKPLGYTEFTFEKTIGGGHSVTLLHLVKIGSGKIKLNKDATEFGYFKKAPTKTISEDKKYLKKVYKLW